MSDSNANIPGQSTGRSKGRIGCLVIVIVLLAVVAFLGFRAVRAATAARSALQEVRALQGLDRDALSSLDPSSLAALRDRFARLEADLTTIETQAGPFLSLSKRLGWLPGVGAEAAAAPELLQLGKRLRPDVLRWMGRPLCWQPHRVVEMDRRWVVSLLRCKPASLTGSRPRPP